MPRAILESIYCFYSFDIHGSSGSLMMTKTDYTSHSHRFQYLDFDLFFINSAGGACSRRRRHARTTDYKKREFNNSERLQSIRPALSPFAGYPTAVPIIEAFLPSIGACEQTARGRGVRPQGELVKNFTPPYRGFQGPASDR